MVSNQFRIVISLRNGGGILVERQMHFGGDNWKTVDRYNTHNLTAELKRKEPWISEVLALCSQPSAEMSIAIPGVPTLEESQYQRLNRVETEMNAILMREQLDAEFKLLKHGGTTEMEIRSNHKAAHA